MRRHAELESGSLRFQAPAWGLPALLVLAAGGALSAAPVDYPIVYVRAPRHGDTGSTTWPEVMHPAKQEPGTDLVVLHPGGREEVLVEAGEKGAAIDPFPTFDAEWVYYSFCPDVTKVNRQRDAVPQPGWDIYKVHVATRETVRLTHQEWTPSTGAGRWAPHPLSRSRGANTLGYGIANLGPCPLPGGQVIFTSSRNGFLPNKGFTEPNLQLFVMDGDGRNVECVGHLNLGSALHPTVLVDGRVMWSSYESQGLRDRRIWALWHSYPDGRGWGPLLSGFHSPYAPHFQTQLSDGRIVVCEYYNQNNWGFGTLLAFPPAPPDPARPPFGSWKRGEIAPQKQAGRAERYPFAPQGLETLTPFAGAHDTPAPTDAAGVPMGKATHPSGAPDGDLLLVYSPGPVNHNGVYKERNKPVVDGGVYLLRGGQAVDHPSELVLIRNDPGYNEQQPKALVTYEEIYGVKEPEDVPWLPQEEHPSLAAGAPFGLVGTSSFYNRNSAPGHPDWNWGVQGSDAGEYSSDDIHAVRIIAFEPTPHRSYGPGEYRAHGPGDKLWYNGAVNERLRILGEIPLRKHDGSGKPVLDPRGDPDTSFLARIPADVSFTFQTLDANGVALNTAQTWHQVRPGEVRTDCGGCHAHNEMPVPFAATAAGKPDFEPADLTSKVRDVEFTRDVLPIFEKRCVPCHSKTAKEPKGGLVLDDGERTYELVAGKRHRSSRHERTKYTEMLQSRRSLLAWKVYGRRLDGEGELPGKPMPPPESGHEPLTDAERRTIAAWIDLGSPISRDPKHGWFEDATRPTLHVESPRAGPNEPLAEIRFGAHDYYSGLDESTLSVTASFPVAGRAAGKELADLFERGGPDSFVWSLALDEPPDAGAGTALLVLTVTVRDRAGNESRAARTFTLAGTGGDEAPRRGARKESGRTALSPAPRR